MALERADNPALSLHYALPYVQMTRYFWKETGHFPGVKDGDPIHLDYNLWEDVLALDEFIEFERAYQLKHGIYEPKE